MEYTLTPEQSAGLADSLQTIAAIQRDNAAEIAQIKRDIEEILSML